MTSPEPTPSRPYFPAALVGVGLLGLLYAALQGGVRSPPQPPPRPAAPFELVRMNGERVRLASLKGKLVMLDFWATWCGPCVEEMPTLVKLAQAYASRGVTFVAANRDDPSTWKVDVGLFADRSVPALPPYVAFADDATTDRYGVEALPTLFLIGRTGMLLGRYTGYADEAELKARIEAALEASK